MVSVRKLRSFGLIGPIFKSQKCKMVGWDRLLFQKRRQGITTICCVTTPKSAVLIYFAAETSNHESFHFKLNRCKQNQNTCRSNKNQSYKDLFPDAVNNKHQLFRKVSLSDEAVRRDTVQETGRQCSVTVQTPRCRVFFSFREQQLLCILITCSSLRLDIPNGLFPTSKWIC